MLSRLLFFPKNLTISRTSAGTKPLLGRWSIVSEKDLFMRSDRSNEDHCGTCGAYIHQKLQDKKLNEKKADFKQFANLSKYHS